MRILPAFFSFLLIIFITPATGQLRQIAEFEKSKARYLEGNVTTSISATNASPDFKVNHYRFEWEVDPAVRGIRGKVTAAVSFTANTSSISFDMAESLVVDSVIFHQNKLLFTRPGNLTLQISLPAMQNTGTRDSITIYYGGGPPSNGFGSFTNSEHNNVPVMWTLSEPYGARDWWPCRNGLTDKADSIDAIITTPEAYFATSNGLFQSESIANNKRTVWWKHRYPIATYLIAMAVTNYEVQQDTIQLQGRVLPLQQYVYPEYSEGWQSSVADTRRIMRFYEQHIGPYPFRNERYAHTQVGFGGGMEHQTNSWMGNYDAPLIAHEMAHQWFGDKVTCGSWQHIWLNEGFATFMNNMYQESVQPKEDMLNAYRSEIATITGVMNGSVFVTDTTSVSRIFDYRLSYLKGSWLLQMLRWKLGETKLYEGLRAYLTDPRLQYNFGRTEDLQRNLEQVSGQDLDEFFKDWFFGEGHPSYHIRWMPLGVSRVQVSLAQNTSNASVNFFEMPVPILFRNSTRDTIIVIDHKISGQTEIRDIGFIPDTVIFDPEVKLISANNTAERIDIKNPPNYVKIFPNPFNAQFTIQLTKFADPAVSITIYSAVGQLMYKKEVSLPAGNEIVMIPSSTWSSGIYIVHVNSKTSKYVKSILK
jgi:aminopeptidase N